MVNLKKVTCVNQNCRWNAENRCTYGNETVPLVIGDAGCNSLEPIIMHKPAGSPVYKADEAIVIITDKESGEEYKFTIVTQLEVYPDDGITIKGRNDKFLWQKLVFTKQNNGQVQ